MARVACTVMLKDEVTLTEPFLRYHAALFGAENLYVFDNGTSEPDVLKVLGDFERKGGHVDHSFTTAEDFRRKGDIVGGLVKRLDADGNYDLYILLDCDEFVALRTDDGYTVEPDAIHRYLDSLVGGHRIIKVDTNLSNIPGSPGTFQVAEYSKTIWPRGVMGVTDHGYHSGWSRNGSTDVVACNIVYIHFHYRPFDEVVRFARQKLSAEVPPEDLEDTERLRNFKGRGWHLVAYVLGDEENYYSQFRGLSNIIRFPEIIARFTEIGGEVPYSGFIRTIDGLEYSPGPDDDGSVPGGNQPYLVIDDATAEHVRGWATDPRAPAEPVHLRFLVDGVTVWERACDGLRGDVKGNGHPTDRVGFDFRIQGAAGDVLTAEHTDGTPVLLFVDGHARQLVTLSPPRSITSPRSEAGPLHLVIDDASAARIRGWTIYIAKPDEPVTLRFLVDGVLVWDGACDLSRPDIVKCGLPNGHVGFDIRLPFLAPGPGILRIEDRHATPMQMLVEGHATYEFALPLAAVNHVHSHKIYSHIDSFRNGRVQGWALRKIETPEGARLLGCCTVAIVQQDRIIGQTIADTVRLDVAEAMQSEPRCGFNIEIPRPTASVGSNIVFGLFIMPERHEVAGSPCVMAPRFELVQ
jgi:hypothetical protein